MNENGLLNQINTAVIRLDEKMTNFGNDLSSLKNSVKEGHGDHENRLRTLESRPVYDPKIEDRFVTRDTLWKVLGAIFTVISIGIAIYNSVK